MLSPLCDILASAKFDFTVANPAFGNLYEMLKVIHLFLWSTQSPVSSTLLNTLQQFKLLAAHTTLTVAKYAVQSVNSSYYFPCRCSQWYYFFTSWNLFWTKYQAQLQSSELKAAAQLSICEQHNLKFDANCSQLQSSEVSTLRADIIELCPAMLVYCIARDRFAVGAHRFQNASVDYYKEILTRNGQNFAPPWPTAESLFFSIGCLKYEHEKYTQDTEDPQALGSGEQHYNTWRF